MRKESGQPQIFNQEKRKIRRARAIRRSGEAFLLRRCAADAADRLVDINRQFEHAALIGLPQFRETLLAVLPADKVPLKVTGYDDWPDVFPEGVDLVISALVLQSLNDVPRAIRKARLALKPDGLFLSSIIGGESLLELRRAAMAADLETGGGAAPRVAPMIDVHQAAGLVQSCGFALPVIDTDRFSVDYTALSMLVSDLRDIGETNVLEAYKPAFAGRVYARHLEAHYNKKTANGRFSVNFEILWLTGWSPHESQQKPLKPGSAKTKLSDSLRRIRDDKDSI